jgi:diguanylate cyclase (GGDEF)-like protein
VSEEWAVVRSAMKRWDIGSSPVVGGRLLLLVAGLVVACSVGALRPSAADWLVIGAVSLLMLTALLASFLVAWEAMPKSLNFVFPLSVIVGLGSLGGFSTANIGSCYTGLFVLCFAYVGVYLPMHSAYPLAVAAAPAFVASVGGWDAYIQIRLGIAVAIWIILAEVIALLVLRQRQITDLLEQSARVDALTGVGNRRDVDEHVARARTGDTLIVCDLDHFKAVNDTLGHAAGDQVLRDFGAILIGCLRGDDYAGRYGGEEFVLILADTDATESEKVLHRLRHKWAASGNHVTFSAGYSTRLRGLSADVVLATADQALYAAKAAGRDQSVYAHAEVRTPA